MAWAETRNDRSHQHAESGHQAGLRPLPARPTAVESFRGATGDYRPVQRGFAQCVESFAPLGARFLPSPSKTWIRWLPVSAT